MSADVEIVLGLTVGNGPATRVQHEQDLGNTTAADIPRKKHKSTRALARAIDLGQLDTPAFVWRESVVCSASYSVSCPFAITRKCWFCLFVCV